MRLKFIGALAKLAITVSYERHTIVALVAATPFIDDSSFVQSYHCTIAVVAKIMAASAPPRLQPSNQRPASKLRTLFDQASRTLLIYEALGAK